MKSILAGLTAATAMLAAPAFARQAAPSVPAPAPVAQLVDQVGIP